MEPTYRPVVAKDEFVGHTFEELQFAQNLKSSVRGFFQILNGEKQGRNAKEAMLELMKEAEEMQSDERKQD
jgi:hypothetical protein